MNFEDCTLFDVSASLDELNDMVVYLSSGSYNEEIVQKVIDHLYDKINDVQQMVNFIRLAPELQQSNS